MWPSKTFFSLFLIAVIVTVVKSRPQSNSDNKQQLLLERRKLPEKLVQDVNYFDKLNVDALLNNRRFVEFQLKCIIYDQINNCDYFGKKTRELLPAVILDNCQLCSERQKIKLSQVVVHMQQNFPAEWRDALIKYGKGPNFITAGQVAPVGHLFGKKSFPKQVEYNEKTKGHQKTDSEKLIFSALIDQLEEPNIDSSNVYPSSPSSFIPVLPQPLSASDSQVTYFISGAKASPIPETIPTLESPLWFSPDGSRITTEPSTPVVESSITQEVNKPTTEP